MKGRLDIQYSLEQFLTSNNLTKRVGIKRKPENLTTLDDIEQIKPKISNRPPEMASENGLSHGNFQR